MAAEILNALAQGQGMKVAGHTSSFYYKGRNEDLRTIGKTLGVARNLPDGQRKAVLGFSEAVQGASGKHAAVAQILTHGPNSVIGQPIMLVMHGRNDIALIELERWIREHDAFRAWVYAVTEYDPPHQDPRFQALHQQVNLPVTTNDKVAPTL